MNEQSKTQVKFSIELTQRFKTRLPIELNFPQEYQNQNQNQPITVYTLKFSFKL